MSLEWITSEVKKAPSNSSVSESTLTGKEGLRGWLASPYIIPITHQYRGSIYGLLWRNRHGAQYHSADIQPCNRVSYFNSILRKRGNLNKVACSEKSSAIIIPVTV